MLTRFSNVQNIKYLSCNTPVAEICPYCATCTAVLEKEAIKYIKNLELLPINIPHQICGPHLATKKMLRVS